MKRTILVLALLALLPIACHSQQEHQDHWDQYQHWTLQSIIDAHQGAAAELDADSSGDKKALLTAESFPSKVTLTYLGKSRPLEGKRQILVKYWAKMMGRPDDTSDIFGTEFLFREGDRELWVAVQKPLLDPLPKEVAIGRQLTAYVMWMGAIKVDDHWEWVFAMNEFDSR
jgi:hypothetical protein